MALLQNTGLILEGGGLRGIYTAGVLDCFLKNDLEFPYVIGVSAGACIGFSYVAKQFGRDRQIMTTYNNDPRYFSLRNLLREGNIFSRQFLYHEIHYNLAPFDAKTFDSSATKMYFVATDCRTGKAVYFEGHDPDRLITIAGSASLPFLSKMVKYKDQLLLDGGITDSIPIRKSLADGNNKNIVILTRPLGYRKKPTRAEGLIKFFYRKYPQLAAAIINRPKVYNETLEFIEKLERTGKVLVIRPSVNLKVNRIEKNKDRLNAQYKLGYADTEKLLPRIKIF